MVASIQRILLHAAAYHKSSFQISTLNLCLVYLIRQMKTIPVIAVFLRDAPNTKQIISCQPFM